MNDSIQMQDEHRDRTTVQSTGSICDTKNLAHQMQQTQIDCAGVVCTLYESGNMLIWHTFSSKWLVQQMNFGGCNGEVDGIDFYCGA